ncbi:MAG: hypothetical protein WCP28_02950 [Actinomycetes bacterium]
MSVAGSMHDRQVSVVSGASRIGRRLSAAGLAIAASAAAAVLSGPVAIAAPVGAATTVSASPNSSASVPTRARWQKAPRIPTFASTLLADIALKYVGKPGSDICDDAGLGGGGQCKQVVNCLIVIAGGRSAADGNDDYAGSYLRVGGREITEESATKGDIIQWGSGFTEKKHTAIVVENLGNHRFDVVDSNWVGYEKVGHHVFKNIFKPVETPRYPKPRFIRVGVGVGEVAQVAGTVSGDSSFAAGGIPSGVGQSCQSSAVMVSELGCFRDSVLPAQVLVESPFPGGRASDPCHPVSGMREQAA